MPLAGQGVLAIWNGIEDEAEADFVAWHVREHIPERVAVPGFLRGRRYVAEVGAPKYFNFYETESPETLVAPAYLNRVYFEKRSFSSSGSRWSLTQRRSAMTNGSRFRRPRSPPPAG